MSKNEESATWRVLKDFIESLPESELDKTVHVVNDEEVLTIIPELSGNDMYLNPDDAEDCWDKENFDSEVNEGNINPDEYVLQPKGTAFLTTEW